MKPLEEIREHVKSLSDESMQLEQATVRLYRLTYVLIVEAAIPS